MAKDSLSLAELVRAAETVLGNMDRAVDDLRIAALLAELDREGFSLRASTAADLFVTLAKTNAAAARAMLFAEPGAILVSPEETRNN